MPRISVVMLKIAASCSYVSSVFAKYADGRYLKAPSLEEVIEAGKWAAGLGFKGVEAEASTVSQLNEVFSPKNVPKIRKAYESLGLEVPQYFGYFDPLIFDFASLDEKKRRRCLDLFHRVVEVAAGLGTRVVTHISTPPPGVEMRWATRRAGQAPSEIIVPLDFSWSRAWENLVDSVGKCCDMAQDAGLLFALEPRSPEMISNTDAMLRLMDTIKANNLGVNLDTGHLFVQREVLPISIEKLGDRIFATHLSDNDGLAIGYHWSPGSGGIEWEGVLRALKKVGYDGFLTLEIVGIDKAAIDNEYVKGKKFIEEAARKVGIKLE